MPDLPARPDLTQLRHQAKDLLRARQRWRSDALTRIGVVSDRTTLASAQLAVAREYGFASWPKLKREVQRREVLDNRDLARLSALLAADPALATESMEHWCDHPKGASPLGYVAMLRYDTSRGVWRDVQDTAALARALIRAGAPVDGEPGDRETPLITAASYGDAAVARVLIEEGADLEAHASPDSGGVPGGSALLHAAVFGMTDVVDVLVAAGAGVHGIEEAAAAGDVSRWLGDATEDARVRALVIAADHERARRNRRLIAAGTPVDAIDEAFGGHPLRTAAGNARPAERPTPAWRTVPIRSCATSRAAHRSSSAGRARRRRPARTGRGRVDPRRARRLATRPAEELDRIAGRVVEHDWRPPGPLITPLRKATPSAPSRSTSASMSSTIKCRRFQPAGHGLSSVRQLARRAELVGPERSSRRWPRLTSATAGEASNPISKAKLRV